MDSVFSKKTTLEADEGKSRAGLASGIGRTKRKFSETNEGKNLIQVANEIEEIERALCELEREQKEIQLETALERFKRNLNVVGQIKKRSEELESSMKKKIEDLTAHQDFEIPYHKNMSEDCSNDSQPVQEVKNNVAEDSNSSNSSDDLCVMPAEKSHGDIKIEQSFYVTDSDVEVLDNAAVMEQRIPNSFVPSTRDLIFTENDPAPAIESASAAEFRRCLMSVLTKPFDADEYAKLCMLFKDGAYSCSYPDVGKRLIDYRYKKGKRLNIFRGFFFWLQNVTQDGSFEPWEDSECLAV